LLGYTFDDCAFRGDLAQLSQYERMSFKVMEERVGQIRLLGKVELHATLAAVRQVFTKRQSSSHAGLRNTIQLFLQFSRYTLALIWAIALRLHDGRFEISGIEA